MVEWNCPSEARSRGGTEKRTHTGTSPFLRGFVLSVEQCIALFDRRDNRLAEFDPLRGRPEHAYINTPAAKATT